jgi:hypothetical protein
MSRNRAETRLVEMLEPTIKEEVINVKHKTTHLVRPEYGQGQQYHKNLDMNKYKSMAVILRKSGIRPTLEELFRTDVEWCQFKPDRVKTLLGILLQFTY